MIFRLSAIVADDVDEIEDVEDEEASWGRGLKDASMRSSVVVSTEGD